MDDPYVWGLYHRGMVEFKDLFPVVDFTIEQLDMLWQLTNHKEVITVSDMLEKEKQAKIDAARAKAGKG